MNDISSISGPQKFTSQLKVSLETTQKQVPAGAGMEMKEIKAFEAELAQIHHAFTLVKEIRASLESALRDLSN